MAPLLEGFCWALTIMDLKQLRKDLHLSVAMAAIPTKIGNGADVAPILFAPANPFQIIRLVHLRGPISEKLYSWPLK